MISHDTKPVLPSTRRGLLRGGISLAGALAAGTLPSGAAVPTGTDIEAAARGLAAAIGARHGGVWRVHVDLACGLLAISRDFSKSGREGATR